MKKQQPIKPKMVLKQQPQQKRDLKKVNLDILVFEEVEGMYSLSYARMREIAEKLNISIGCLNKSLERIYELDRLSQVGYKNKKEAK